MNRSLLIIGAGTYGRFVQEIAQEMRCFDQIDFLDNYAKNTVGTFVDYEKKAEIYSHAIAVVENPQLRLEWIHKLEEAGFIVPALVHPLAYIAPSAQIQKGCIIEPQAVVQTGSVLAIGVIISSGAVVGHDSFVGDVCNIECNAVIAPHSVVEAGTKVCAGAAFIGTNMKELNYDFQVEM